MRPQWVAWSLESIGAGPLRKVPYSAITGLAAHYTSPGSWSSYEHAVRQMLRLARRPASLDSGVGFVVSSADPYVGIDLDHCLSDTGELVGEARAIVDSMHSYTEVTPSKKGLRIWVRGKLPPGPRRKRFPVGFSIELYDQERYFTVTGEHLPGTPTTIEDRVEELLRLHSFLFPESDRSERSVRSVRCSPDELRERARRVRENPKFLALWNGDLSRYEGDRSRADAALCWFLLQVTGGDVVAADRLFRESTLYRPKWDEKHGRQTYGEMTLSFVRSGR